MHTFYQRSKGDHVQVPATYTTETGVTGGPTRAGCPAHVRRPRDDPRLTGPGQCATPQVTISEQTPNQLRIDLGSDTFNGASTAQATGLSYENAGSPATSTFATVDISQPDNISTLQASLPGTTVTLGPISDAAGGLDNVAVTQVSSSWQGSIHRRRARATAT